MSTKWFSLQKILSYNALFNIVLSSRGGGKTYATTKHMIKLFLNKGVQSAYIRRNKVEMDDVKPTFFHAIVSEFPGVEFEVKGDIGYINKEPAIHFIALSTSSNKKSKAYPKVGFALFDEYIITNNGYKRYLKNEMTLLFDICETIFRSRNDWRIVFLSNSVSYVCPLFSEFNIEPDNKKEFQTFKNKLICLQIFESDEYTRDKKETRFAQLLEGTKYYEYAINNEVLEDTNDFIVSKRMEKLIFHMSIYSNGQEIGIWQTLEGKKYIDYIVEKDSKFRYYVLDCEAKEGMQNIKSHQTTWRIRNVKRSFLESEVFYCNQEVKKFFTTHCVRYM